MADLRDDGLLERVLDQLGVRHPSLGENLVQFAALLNAAELSVTTTQLLDAARALQFVDIAQRGDFHQALAACLLARHEDRPAFDLLFDRFWRLPREEQPPERPDPSALTGGEARLGMAQLVDAAYVRAEAAGSAGETPPETYSRDDALLSKDFATFRDGDLRAARRHLRRLALRLATAASRRRRPGGGGEVDLRRSLRRAARRGGELIELARRRRRLRRVKLVVLCDVSGSMDVYSRFLVQFLFGLQRELRGAGVYVFSTRLFDLSPALRTRSFDDALARIARRVDGWSGGTRIGECLAEFNTRHARQRVGRRTVVAVISDGWERGDIAQLEREMRRLRRRAYRVLWLNPLLGGSGYKPLAQGMQAALPHVDHFLPVHNLASLERLTRELARLSRG